MCRTKAGLLVVPSERYSFTACPAASSQRGTSAWLSPPRPPKPTGHTLAAVLGPTTISSPPEGPAARTERRCHLRLLLPRSPTTHLLPCQLLCQPPSLPFNGKRVPVSAAGPPRTRFLQSELMHLASWTYLMALS